MASSTISSGESFIDRHPEPEDVDRWGDRPLAEVIDHIVARYHEDLRAALPTIIELSRVVEDTHATHAERPVGLTPLLESVLDGVQSHMAKEEQILFPLIRSGRGMIAQQPIQVMLLEHRDHADQLSQIRTMTGDFEPPADACAAWVTLYRELELLERELTNHIRLENEVLFVRALGFG